MPLPAAPAAGNSRNSTMMVPSRAMVPAIRRPAQAAGLPTARGVDQRRQQAHQRQQHRRGRQQRLLRERRSSVSIVKKPRKNDERVASGPQLQRLERQQHRDRRDAGIAPEQRCVNSVAPTVSTSRPNTHQRDSPRLRAVQACRAKHRHRQPRLHHNGGRPACSASTTTR